MRYWLPSAACQTPTFLGSRPLRSSWTGVGLCAWTPNGGQVSHRYLRLAMLRVSRWLAHKASHEGRVAVEVIAGHTSVFEPLAIPAVVFTDPEVAWCGLTETQAAEAQRPVSVARFPWAASGRAVTLDRPEGVTKLVIERETERLLGVGIVGTGAGELIAEGVVAIEMRATLSDLKRCIHPHPTLSETLLESAEAFTGRSTHMYRRARPV